MKIFLSYASQDSEAAKSIYLALREQRHTVFFDRAGKKRLVARYASLEPA